MRFALASCFVVFAAACVPPEPSHGTATATPQGAAPPSGPYVVLPVQAVDAPLFAEDERALQAKVLTLISAQGAEVVKLDELASLSGPEPSCRVSRAPSERAIARWGRAPQVRVVASCQSRPCSIALTIERPPASADAAWETLDRFEANVDAPDMAAGWLAALDKLGPPPVAVGALVVGAANAGPPTAHADSVTAFGTWESRPLPTLFDFGKCFENGAATGFRDHVRLEVDESGAPTKCEIEPDPKHAVSQSDSTRFACLCDVGRAAKFSAGKGARRVDVAVRNDPHATVDARSVRYGARLQRLRASDGAAIATPAERATMHLASCAAASGVSTALTMRLRLDVDPQGTVTKVAMDGTNDVLRACAGATLRGLALPCGRSGAYQVDGELVVWAESGAR